MFLELTDLLTCPRCGPQHGLILLVQEVEGRRIMQGWLGCPHCRRDFPIRDGVADLRLRPEEETAAVEPVEDPELAVKVLALTGLAEERAFLLLDEALAHAAEAVVEMAPDLEVITLGGGVAESGERPGISRVLIDAGFPFVEYRLRGAAIAARGATERVRSTARRVAAGARLVLFETTPDDLKEAEGNGLVILAAEAGTAVAERSGGSLPIVG